MEKIRAFFQNKRNLIITIAAACVLLAGLAWLIFWSLGNKGPAPDALPMANVSEEPSEPEVSVPEISSAPAVSIADIAPVVSSEPETSSKAENSSTPAKKAEPQASSQLAVTGTPESVPEPKPESKEEKKTENKTEQGLVIPQPNEKYAKAPNRNAPSFSVDNTIEGSGGWHGDTMDSEYGTMYYHAGLNEWIDEFYWTTCRFGQHQEASQNDFDFFNQNQYSPFQEEGDYSSLQECYFCSKCHAWVLADAWENGKHGEAHAIYG